MGLNGVINVLKPPGMTSSDVVVYLKKLLKVKKVGHAGTLDPNAAGVLVICIGKATKIVDYIMEDNKTYRGGLVLGVETDTLDADGRIINQSSIIPHFSSIEKVFNKYQGKLLQKPPMYSARKYRGKRLYELARQGQEVEVPPRSIEIFENKILEYYPPNEIFFEVTCTKGTYIRSLVRDIGQDLGCGAYMSFLIRTSSGTFTIENSFTLQEIKDALLQQSISNILIPTDKALSKFKSIILKDHIFSKAINGNIINLDAAASDISNMPHGELLRIYCKHQFIGLGYINDNNRIQMRKVLV